MSRLLAPHGDQPARYHAAARRREPVHPVGTSSLSTWAGLVARFFMLDDPAGARTGWCLRLTTGRARPRQKFRSNGPIDMHSLSGDRLPPDGSGIDRDRIARLLSWHNLGRNGLGVRRWRDLGWRLSVIALFILSMSPGSKAEAQRAAYSYKPDHLILLAPTSRAMAWQSHATRRCDRRAIRWRVHGPARSMRLR